jgi:hypothetical protein
VCPPSLPFCSRSLALRLRHACSRHTPRRTHTVYCSLKPAQLPFASQESVHDTASTCTQNMHQACRLTAEFKARSAPGQDTRSGQGALARRHTDGPLCAALLKTMVMCEAWRRRTIVPRILLEFVQLLATSASPRAKSLILIPVPVQYRLSQCLE